VIPIYCSKIFFAINCVNINFFYIRLPTVAGPRLPSSLLSVASSSLGQDSYSSYSSLSKNEQGRCLNSAIDMFWAAQSPTDASRVQNTREQQRPEDAADLFPTDRKCGVCLFATRKRSELTWWVYIHIFHFGCQLTWYYIFVGIEKNLLSNSYLLIRFYKIY
jgi:hypothetical protein